MFELLASTVELRASNAELLASTVELLASYVELYSKHLRSQTELPANKFAMTNVRVTCLITNDKTKEDIRKQNA